MADLLIGTSGWSYEHWKGRFYPPGLPAEDRLAYYAERFGAVEVNSTFYGPPSAETVRRWAEATPPGFRFAVKASRLLTHDRALAPAPGETEAFFRGLKGLGGKLSTVLFQLPPRTPFDAGRLAAFLERLPTEIETTFEFRDPRWWNAEAYALLAARGAAFCIFDLNRKLSPLEVTAPFAYVRLHGPVRPYHDRYSDAAREEWARRIEGWRAEGKGVRLFFDNTEKADAARDARALRLRLEGGPPPEQGELL